MPYPKQLARIATATLLGYLGLSLVLGIALGELGVHLPRHRVDDEAAFRARVYRQFQAHVADVSLNAADHAALQAWYVQPPVPNGRTVILLHGITSNRESIAGLGDIFLARGYSVLVPDSREHGASGGRLATYGILERDDVRRWTQWAAQRSPECVYLLGESMGAAIGLQATAVTPELCAVAVESPYATFRQVSFERLGGETGLGTRFWQTAGRPIVEVAIAYARLRYGVYLPDAAPETAVQNSRVPALLIAGTADRDIPMHNAQELERACATHCSLWIVPGATHGSAAITARSDFDRRVLEWFDEHDHKTFQGWTTWL